MIPVMVNWVDQQREKKKPFLLGYETFMSHGPILQFTRNSKANRYLNSVAYTDRFLKKLVQEFEEQHTRGHCCLFFLGDHSIHGLRG